MFNMFKKQGTSKRSASTSSIGDREPGFGKASPTGEQAIAGDMAIAGACEELEDALLATVCGGRSRVEACNDLRTKLIKAGFTNESLKLRIKNGPVLTEWGEEYVGSVGGGLEATGEFLGEFVLFSFAEKCGPL
jgi:hypothetical protein